MVEDCIICKVIETEDPVNWYIHREDSDEEMTFYVYKTKNMKGHRVRLMVMPNYHVAQMPDMDMMAAAIGILQVSMKIEMDNLKLKDENFFVFSDKHSTVMNHWHRVASTIDHDVLCDDFELILRTPTMTVNREVLSNT